MTCCNERRCKRAKPIKVFRSDLTGTWYVTTDYVETVTPEVFSANTKHRLEDTAQVKLEAMRNAKEQLDRAVEILRQYRTATDWDMVRTIDKDCDALLAEVEATNG